LVIDRFFQNISKCQKILVFGTEYKVAIANQVECFAELFVDAIFSKALDVVGQADPELPGKVLSGTFKISHENLVALSKMPPEEIRRIGTRPEDLQHPFTSYSDTRKEFADTDEEPVESMQETLPLIKIPPMHDPDAEIAGLTLTVPSWVSSIERARNNADMNAASTSAKSKLEEALLSLQEKVSEMLSEIREVD
jgi:hypothetical protein